MDSLGRLSYTETMTLYLQRQGRILYCVFDYFYHSLDKRKGIQNDSVVQLCHVHKKQLDPGLGIGMRWSAWHAILFYLCVCFSVGRWNDKLLRM